MSSAARDTIKNYDPVTAHGFSKFLPYECPQCGNKQRFPLRNRIIHNIICNRCGHLQQLTFILGDK